MKIEHQNDINAKGSKKSGASKQNTNMILAAFMIFIFPIIAIFLGVFIGGTIGNAVNASPIIFKIIGGVVGVVLAGVVIKIFDKSSKIDENIEKIHWDDL